MRELDARLAVEGMTDEEARQLPVHLDGAFLAAMEISTWTTEAGHVDVLSTLPSAEGTPRGYEQLVARANRLATDRVVIRVAALEDIIASKEWANRPKDRQALPELRALRDAAAGEDDASS